jgi:hypothetical protein
MILAGIMDSFQIIFMDVLNIKIKQKKSPTEAGLKIFIYGI